MSKQRITIREIAAAAGVSTSAVSYVINGKKGVSEETRRKIQGVIERYDYQPNINSVRLVSQKSFNIRIATQPGSSPFDDLFFYEIAQGVVEGSSRAGYNIIFSHLTGHDAGRAFIDGIHRGDTDGIVFFLDVDPQLLYEVRDAHVPAVIIDGHQAESSIAQVRADYSIAAETATAHLISRGHKELALLGSNKAKGYFDQVFSGFRRAVTNASLSTPTKWVFNDVNDDTGARSVVAELLGDGDIPNGVVCASDLAAVGAIQEFKQRGYRVPEDVSLVGIDDIVLSRYIEPALSTVRINKKQMGQIAVDLLMQLIDGRDVETVVVRSDSLIERASVLDRR
jgi:DNA-binding LacI/PurR family transcriptional regulator